MTRTETRSNRYAATCATCATHIPAGAGRLAREDGEWLVFCDTDACQQRAGARETAEANAAAELDELVRAEAARREAAGETPDYWDVLADVQAAQRAARQPAKPTRRTATSRRSPARRRKACVTGGNCSAHSGRHCGGYNCDAN